jgi:putative ABC transport system permease protein
MIGRIGPVTSVSATGVVRNAHVYRNDHIPAARTGSVAVLAARTDVLATVGGSVASGQWLNAATSAFDGHPTTVYTRALATPWRPRPCRSVRAIS